MPNIFHSEIEEELKKALMRADVYRWYNYVTNTITLYSMNKEAPLTEEEKHSILTYMSLRLYPYRIEFAN